ncbi:MAG: hypothetical protein ACM3NH_04770 [Candidatus Saccharibacteria bacterium]
MRRFLFVMVVVAALLCAVSGSAQTPCTPVKIQTGTVMSSVGPIATGFDKWGYNYQAHMFNGLSSNYSRPEVPDTDGTEQLVMKWSDDWLANVACEQDSARKLARGYDPKTGMAAGVSKGWVTNHYEGDYLGDDNEYHHYTYFVKIVWVGAAPTDGTTDPWAGKRVWGSYAIIEEVNNDPYNGFHGVSRDSLVNPAGLGFWTK